MKITVNDIVNNESSYVNRVPTGLRDKAIQILLSLSNDLEDSVHRLIESVSINFLQASEIGFCMEFHVTIILPQHNKTKARFIATWEVDLRDNIALNQKILLRAEENSHMSCPFEALTKNSRVSQLGPHAIVVIDPKPADIAKAISFAIDYFFQSRLDTMKSEENRILSAKKSLMNFWR